MKTIYTPVGILSLLFISSNAQWKSQQSPNYKQNTGSTNIMQQKPLNTGYQFQNAQGQNRVTKEQPPVQKQRPRPLKQTELQQSEESGEESVETKSSEQGQFDRRGMGQDRRNGQSDQRRINQQGSMGQRGNNEGGSRGEVLPSQRGGDRREIGQPNINQNGQRVGTGREQIGGAEIPSSQQDQPRRSQGRGQFGITNEQGTGIGEDFRGSGVSQEQPRQGQGERQFGMANGEGTGVRNGGSGFGISQEQPRQGQGPNQMGPINQDEIGQGQFGGQQPAQGQFGSTNGARNGVGRRGQFGDSINPTQAQFGSTNSTENRIGGQFGSSQRPTNPAQQQPAQGQFGSTNGAREGTGREVVSGGRGIPSSEAGDQTGGFGSSNEVSRRRFGEPEIPTLEREQGRGNIQPMQQGRGQIGQTIPQEIPTISQAAGRGSGVRIPSQSPTGQTEQPLQRVTPSPPERVGERQGAIQPLQPGSAQVPQALPPEQGQVDLNPGVGQTNTPRRIPNIPNETDRGGTFGGSRGNNVPSFMGGGNSPGQGPGTSMFDQPMNRRGMFGGFGRNPLGGAEQPGQSNGNDQFGSPDFSQFGADQNSMFGQRGGFGASRGRQTSRGPEQLNRQRQTDVDRTRQNDQNSRNRSPNEYQLIRRQSTPRQTRENSNSNRRREDQQREFNRNG